MGKEKPKILAVYKPHIVYRILDTVLAVLLTLPVLSVLWIFPEIPSENRFMAIMICLLPLAYVIVVFVHLLRFRLIATSEGLILQEFRRREVPYEAMVRFDWQVPYYSRNAYLPKLGIALSTPTDPLKAMSRLFYGSPYLNTSFFALPYVPIPQHFGILRREINFEKFIKTEFGQILYQYAPQLFEQEVKIKL